MVVLSFLQEHSPNETGGSETLSKEPDTLTNFREYCLDTFYSLGHTILYIMQKGLAVLQDNH